MAKASLGAAALVVTVAAMGGGCTTSLASRPDPIGAGAPTEGISYRLPAAQFDITVTWTLKKCIAAKRLGDAGAVEFAAAGEFKSAIIEGESRYLDYVRMTNRFKTGELKVEFHGTEDKKTQLVKSINGAIEGHEAAATSETIKLVGSVVRIAMGLPAAGSGGAAVAGGPAPLPTPCTQATLDMIAELDVVSGRIKAIPAEAKAIEDRMAVLKARLVGGRLTPADRVELARRQAEADKLTDELAALTAVSARLKASLSYSETWTFPKVLSDRTGAFAADGGKTDRWLKALLAGPAVSAVPADTFSVSVTMEPLVSEASCNPAPIDVAPASCAGSTGTYGGFVYRQPVQAKLQVSVPSQPKPVISETVMVPQFGRLRVLPLRSRWGEKNTLTASFALDGTPASIEYKSFNAPGLAALKNANEATGSALALMGAIDAKEKADAAEAKADKAAKDKEALDGLTQQIAVLEAQAKLGKLTDGEPDAVADLQAELAVLRLQKEKSDLEAAMRKNAGN